MEYLQRQICISVDCIIPVRFDLHATLIVIKEGITVWTIIVHEY